MDVLSEYTVPDALIAARGSVPHRVAAEWLQRSVQLWFAVAVVGQWIFTYYIVAAYWLPVGRGESEHWSNLLTDFNLAFMAHVGLATAVFVGGPLQFIPRIRKQFPRFHRWNGRVYLASVATATGAGLYLIWAKGTVGGIGVQVGTSLSAALVAFFGWQAVRCAIAGQLELHRQWALRLFLSAVAVWFYRIQLMVWLMVSGGKGLDPVTFEGPALVITSFTQYLIPLAVLEIYFHIKNQGPAARLAFAGMLGLLTALMAVGISAATVGMWLPRI